MRSSFKRRFSRRDVLGIGLALAGGSALGVVGSHVVRRWRQPEAAVTIIRADCYDQNLVNVLTDGLRLYPEFCQSVRGRRVVLKANLVEYHSDRVVNTHPSLVASAVEAFRHLDAREVIVAEGPGHRRDTELLLEESGLDRALQAVRARFIDLNLEPMYPIQLGPNLSRLGRLWLPRAVLDSDIVVSLPKMKTHHLVGATLSMKNLFGVLPGARYGWPKNLLHWRGIEECIVDVNLAVKPAFAIIDGIEAMEGDGPIYGERVKAGVIVLGNRLPAVDATAARIMGIQPGHLSYLYRMLEHGGTINESRITQLGEPIAAVHRDFALTDAFQYLRQPLPIIDFASGV
ncbi:MAG: DUF362 domain-containing protein [Acidobacteriota bacterium]